MTLQSAEASALAKARGHAPLARVERGCISRALNAPCARREAMRYLEDRMEFWQLMSILDDRDRAIEIASSRASWHVFEYWMQDYGRIVASNDREKLDYVVPVELAEECLQLYPKLMFFSPDGHLRSFRATPDDEIISAVDAFRRYGGNAVHEAYEYGSYLVKSGMT